MSDIIQLLPDSVANQIAAGEVIQRPASVVKELVENAVDAAAKNIGVVIVDAGRTLIQVYDDGKGMSETDARLSFERHATSKIRNADDLFALHTMGFRGEALASIAAVAQVELTTRQAKDELGTRLKLSASRVVSQEPCSCAVGSNFKVENIFFNVPARRKFLKSNATELNNILTAFERIALVYPDIAFTLKSNGSEVFNLRAGNLRQRVVDVFGKRINQDLMPVNVDTTVCKITGFVGKPESARKKGANQYFFVNGRYMRHPYFHKAVMGVFDRLVPTGEQVPYYIYLTVPPQDIDVNIHPTKTEIKFENDQVIWQILSAAVREAVGKFNDIPSIDFDTEGKPEIPVFNPERTSAPEPKVSYNPHYNPFKSDTTAPSSKGASQWEQLYQGLDQTEEPAGMFDTLPQLSQESIAERSPVHYQYKGRYIMTAVKSGLMVIDQHRAHLRILYEQYLQQRRERAFTAQAVLFPEQLSLSPGEVVMLQKALPELQSMGFSFEERGAGAYAITTVPAGIDGLSLPVLVREMLADAADNADIGQDIFHSLALSLARSAAIPQGQVLDNAEMENIINRLFSCEEVKYTPNGKVILRILGEQEIGKMFL